MRPTPASTRTANSIRPRPGLSMLETAFGLLMRLVDAGQLDLSTLIRLLTVEPARVFG